MNRDNVVAFDDFARGRFARRGASDKMPFEADRFVEVRCPRCAAVFGVDPRRMALAPELLCDGCDATIALRAEAVDVR